MAEPISPLHLRALQTLWSKKMRLAGIDPASEDARSMRHEYIRAATSGRAAETKELTIADARKVIHLIAADIGERRSLRIRDRQAARAAGTHGRRGYDDGRQAMLAGEAQFELLRTLQARLGWDQVRLDAFIARQLGDGRTIRTMRDANAVVWPLKRMIRADKNSGH